MARQSVEKGKNARIPYGLLIFQWTIGALIIGLITAAGYVFQDIIPVPENVENVSERLSYAIQCMFPMVLVMIRNVLSVSLGRINSHVFNPLGGHEYKIQVLKNILANTTEQLLISVILMLVYACAMTSPAHLKIIPLYSLCFFVARVLFIIGYRTSPSYRSLGMSMNFLIVFLMTFFLLYHYYNKFITKLFTYSSNDNNNKNEL